MALASGTKLGPYEIQSPLEGIHSDQGGRYADRAEGNASGGELAGGIETAGSHAELMVYSL